MRSLRGDPRGTRAWTLVLLALFVLAEGLSFGHRALESHTVCLEHGELTHDDGHGHALLDVAHAAPIDHGDHGEGLHATDPHDADGPEVAPRGQADVHGDHCDLGLRGLGDRDAPRPVLLLATLPAQVADTVRAPQRTSVHQRRWLVAPKQSPPVAG